MGTWEIWHCRKQPPTFPYARGGRCLCALSSGPNVPQMARCQWLWLWILRTINFYFLFIYILYQWETVEIASLQSQLPLWTKLLPLWPRIPVSGLKVLVFLIILMKVSFKFLMQEDDVCCHTCSGCQGTKHKLAAQICSWNCVTKIKRKPVSFWNNTDIGRLIHFFEFLKQSNLTIPSSDRCIHLD